MGLLNKATAEIPQSHQNSRIGTGDMRAAINDFYAKNPLFHCVVMQFAGNRQQALADIAEMIAFHDAACYSLPGSNGLVLLPGGLDMELFSSQLSKSTGSTVLFQFSANSSTVAIETLGSYLR